MGGEEAIGGAGASGGSGGLGGEGGQEAIGGEGGRSGGAAGGEPTGGGGGTAGAGGGGVGGSDGCPVAQSFSATPSVIPAGETQSLIELEASDPDGGPDPLRSRLSATTGTFEDPEASTTTYTCGAPGPADITARITDGDPECDVEETITVTCPNDIPINLCPKLFTVNAIPSVIPPGQDFTEVQRQASDPDDGPLPLVTTFYALRGTFDDPNAEETIYRCERSGLQEICVDASDGACVKTLCMDVICPEE